MSEKVIAINFGKILMCWEIAYRGASQVERMWLEEYKEELNRAIQNAAKPPELPPPTDNGVS